MIKKTTVITYELEQKDIEFLTAMRNYCSKCDGCHVCVLNREGIGCGFTDTTDRLSKLKIDWQNEIKE